MKLSIAVAALALFIYLVNGSPVHSLHGGPQVNQYNVFFNLEIGAANKSPMQKPSNNTNAASAMKDANKNIFFVFVMPYFGKALSTAKSSVEALSVVPSFVRSLFEKTALESQKEANATKDDVPATILPKKAMESFFTKCTLYQL
ncbi:hypothetical protein M513_11888 [Trichuris suis]|uniref:Uncharacterized protein n=1 Tax=Trichuris suis TaxID=68888 RepID=A0A085LQJ3_9BILA|nr:hypothetical protein M513_11888 [Trichuris suis]